MDNVNSGLQACIRQCYSHISSFLGGFVVGLWTHVHRWSQTFTMRLTSACEEKGY